MTRLGTDHSEAFLLCLVRLLPSRCAAGSVYGWGSWQSLLPWLAWGYSSPPPPPGQKRDLARVAPCPCGRSAVVTGPLACSSPLPLLLPLGLCCLNRCGTRVAPCPRGPHAVATSSSCVLLGPPPSLPLCLSALLCLSLLCLVAPLPPSPRTHTQLCREEVSTSEARSSVRACSASMRRCKRTCRPHRTCGPARSARGRRVQL